MTSSTRAASERTGETQKTWVLLPERHLAGTVLNVPDSLYSGGTFSRSTRREMTSSTRAASSGEAPISEHGQTERCRANSVQIRQSNPDSNLGSQVEILKTFEVSIERKESTDLLEVDEARDDVFDAIRLLREEPAFGFSPSELRVWC